MIRPDRSERVGVVEVVANPGEMAGNGLIPPSGGGLLVDDGVPALLGPVVAPGEVVDSRLEGDDLLPESTCFGVDLGNTYTLTHDGIRVALFYTKVHDRILRPLLANPDRPPTPHDMRQALQTIDHTIADLVTHARLSAA